MGDKGIAVVLTAARCRSFSHAATAAIILILGLALSGCSSGLPTIDTQQVKISAAMDANADAPVAVDLVFAMDEDALAAVSNLASAQWFKDKSQIVLALPTGVRVRSFELSPQRNLQYTITRDEEKAVGAFVFAAYPTPGTHRARIDRLKNPVARLGRSAFSVETGN